MTGQWKTFSWGIPFLDQEVELRAGTFYVIVGDSSHLKSTLAIHVVASVLATRTCLVLPFEEGCDNWLLRLISRATGVPTDQVIHAERLKGQQDRLDKITAYEQELQEHGRLILPNLANIQTVAQLETAIDTYHPDLVLIDYLQLFPGESASEETKLTQLAQDLQRLSSLHDICMLTISSINRQALDKKHRPTLYSMRGSHGIVHSAYAVVGVFYPYAVNADEHSPSEAEIAVLKNKAGPVLDWVDLNVNPETGLFTAVNV